MTAFERVSFWLFGAVIALAPLPLASNRLWSWSLLGVMTGLLLLAWAVRRSLAADQEMCDLRPLLLPAVLMSGVIAFIAVQASCWTPLSWHHPVWQLVEHLPRRGTCPAITLDRFATWTGLARLLTYVGVFLLAFRFGQSGGRARAIVRIVALSSAIYACYGLVLHFIGSDTIFWYDKWAYHDVVTGPFVNRNAFAVYVGMGAACNLAIVLQGCMDKLPTGNLGTRMRALLAGLLTERHVYLAGFTLCAMATILTASRAGTAATVFGLCILVIAAGVHYRIGWQGRTAGIALIVVIVTGGALLGGSRLLERLDMTSEHVDRRGLVIGTTLRAVPEHAFLGTGYGTFETAWTLIRPPRINRWFRQAHSTYAENLLELGVPAALTLFVAVAWPFVVCMRGLWRRRRNGLLPGVALAAGMIPVVQSSLDFSLQMPAIVVVLAALLGQGMAQSYPSQQGQKRRGAARQTDPSTQ